ncbi:hypothetical protein, variant [Aphanomyces invadans]|uniref:Uncharacterized protein n=1 Tax=Aphanomyces invadans TaxID=157072 RepID=A0A024TV82_9STRA|nr:hypothetical protein, variant [Aphanomyces invadans]ETV97267.1 hypothetical protein, variant [Aphanomyces invadans]|eukprot:XP_008873975.1 hypothetical protein, variant [Aphanomyces invadans]
MSSCSMHHVMSHELKGLETFVAQGLAKLPTLTADASVKCAHKTCSVYHGTCSGLLREVLDHMAQFSPKHCKLIADIWDVASVNVLLLLKVCQAAVQEKLQVQGDFAQFTRFSQNCSIDQTAQVSTLAATVEALKTELRETKAEMQTMQRRLGRAVFEKERLEKILDRVTSTANGTDTPHQDSEDEDDDMAAEGFLIRHHDILHYQEATPLETVVDDLEKLFGAVEQENSNQLATVSHLDRYIDSNLVSILWKHQAASHRNPFVEKMFCTEAKTTQTDETLTRGDDENQQLELDESLQSPRMRKKILAIPSCIRSLLDSVPKVHKMLNKRTLGHTILTLYIRKLDSERTKPNMTFPLSIREYFMFKFGLKSLTDFHLVELVKSVIYSRRKLENFTALYDTDKSGCNLLWEDARIFLFGRFLNIFPDEALCSYLPEEGVATLLDFLGDVLELDPTVTSLQAVLEIDGPVMLTRDVVVLVWKTHFGYILPEIQTKVEYDLNEHDRDHATSVDMDWVLSYVLYQWSNSELELDGTIRRAFRDVLMATSGSHPSNLLLQMDGGAAGVARLQRIRHAALIHGHDGDKTGEFSPRK